MDFLDSVVTSRLYCQRFSVCGQQENLEENLVGKILDTEKPIFDKSVTSSTVQGNDFFLSVTQVTRER